MVSANWEKTKHLFPRMIPADELVQGGQLGILGDIPFAAELYHARSSGQCLLAIPRQIISE